LEAEVGNSKKVIETTTYHYAISKFFFYQILSQKLKSPKLSIFSILEPDAKEKYRVLLGNVLPNFLRVIFF
jgi:hypothetical protein